jgi:fatty acid desaturase
MRPVVAETARGPMLAARPAGPERLRLRQLEQLRPWRVAVDVARCYGLIALAFGVLAQFDAWWAYGLAFVVIGTQQYALALIEHDGKHGMLMRSRMFNDLLSRLLICAPLGVDIDFAGAKQRHREHHRWLGTELDPIRKKYVARDKATPGRFLWFLTGLAAMADDLAIACRLPDPSAAIARGRAWRLLCRWAPVGGAQVAICAALTQFVPWWYYAVFWLAPIYVLVFLPSKLRTFCDHGHAVLADAAADQRRLISYTPGVLERLFLSPVSMHYHAEHHLWPSVPYYNLPALHRRVAGSAEIELRGSYVGFLWTYFRSLPLTPSISAGIRGTRSPEADLQ